MWWDNKLPITRSCSTNWTIDEIAGYWNTKIISQASKRNNLKCYPALITLGLLGRRVVLQDPGVHQTLQGMHFFISTFLGICSIIFFCVKPPCPAGSSDWDLSSAAGWSGRARPRTRARGTWWTWTIKYSEKDWRWGILFPGKMCWRKRTWGRPW